MGYKGEQCSGGRTLLRTHGEKLQLARGISTKSRSSSVALRQIRTIGYQGELWRRNGGESGSRTYIFRSWFSSLLAISRVQSSAKVTPRRYSPPSPVASLTLSRHAPIRMRRPPLTSRIMSSRCRRHFGSGRVRFRSGREWSVERHRRARCGKPAVLFLSANTARHPAGICAGIGSNRR